jgi:hypothetical protein
MLGALFFCSAFFTVSALFAIDLGGGFWLGMTARMGGAYEYNKDGDGSDNYAVGRTFMFTNGDPLWKMEINQEGKFGAHVALENGVEPRDVRPYLWAELGPFRVAGGRMDTFKIDRYGVWEESTHLGVMDGIDITWNTPLEGLRVSWFAPIFESYEDNHPGGYYVLENMLGESAFGVTYEYHGFSVRLGLRLADWPNIPEVFAVRDDKTMRAVWEFILMPEGLRWIDAGLAGEAFRINDADRVIVKNYFKGIFDITNVLPLTTPLSKLRLGLRFNLGVENGTPWWTGGTYGDRTPDRHTNLEPLFFTEVKLFVPLTFSFETGPLFRIFNGWHIPEDMALAAKDDWRMEWSVKTNVRYNLSDKFNVQLQYRYWKRFKDSEAAFALTPIDNHLFALWATLTY